MKEVGDRGGVDVGQPNEPPGEVTRSTPRPEHAAKPRVENGLHAYTAHVHRRRWSGGSSTSGYMNSSTACYSRNNTQGVHGVMSSVHVCVCVCSLP